MMKNISLRKILYKNIDQKGKKKLRKKNSSLNFISDRQGESDFNVIEQLKS